MLTSVAGTVGGHDTPAVGDVLDVDPATAEAWADGIRAEPADETGAAAGGGVPPDGTVDDVLGWVDGDPARAAAAAAAERDGKGRTTLLSRLEELADGG